MWTLKLHVAAVALVLFNSACGLPGSQVTTPSPASITKIWSTTETQVSYPGWVGPTVLSMITTQTYTTIQPVVTSYPTTVTDEAISSITWEYRFYYSDGSSYTSIGNGVYTNWPTSVLSAAPTPAFS